MSNQNMLYKFVILFLLLLPFGSCKKFVEVDAPVTNPSSSSIYKNDATAIAVLNSVYSRLATIGIVGGNYSISTLGALSADELENFSFDLVLSQTYSNSLQKNTDIYFWRDLYQLIYTSNAALEGLSRSNELSAVVMQQLEGESKFLRGMFYFYLVNLYGDVPLLLTTDYRTNAVAGRAAKSEVFKQIISDLKEAQSLLSNNFLSVSLLTSTPERIRPTKWAATAFLARAYLFNGEWVNAEAEATKLINNVSVFSLVTNLDNVFKKNSAEAIWQLQPTGSYLNTLDALIYKLTGVPGSSENFSLSSQLMAAFEPGDKRREEWVDSINSGTQTYYYPFKYQVSDASPTSEYYMVLRLAEQYLIRAEARAQQNKIAESQEDLNSIRNRAGLSPTLASDKTSLLAAIQKERQVELFTEWGHRWFDLKRTGSVDAVMSTVTPLKGGVWNTTKQLYPIPESETRLNSSLVQNSGY